MNLDAPNSSDPKTFAIIGAAMAVHRALGIGFVESIYRDALAIELELRQVPFDREVPCRVHYRGRLLRDHYRLDFLCFRAIIVEIKARSITGGAETAQVLNYLASTGHQVALLLNFGAARLQYKRYVLSKRVGDEPLE